MQQRGRRLQARTLPNQRTEAKIGCNVLDQMIPAVSGNDLFQCMLDPGIVGECGEPTRFLAQSIPGLAEGFDDGIEILVQPEGEKPLAQVEPDPLDWIEFGAVRRQRNQSDVVGYVQRLDVVPSGLIGDERDVSCLGEGLGELGQEQIHGCGIRVRQHQGKGIIGGGAHGGEDVGRLEPLVAPPRRTLTAVEPAVTGAALLALSGLVLEPKLQRLVGMRRRYVLQLHGKVFLKSARASASPCGCDGRAFCQDSPIRRSSLETAESV